MAFETRRLFHDDAYLSIAEGRVVGITEHRMLRLDQTNFYARSGGQPGDTGWFERADGSRIAIVETLPGDGRSDILHPAPPGEPMPELGETLVLHIDWERRYRLMRMHSACHLLSVVCPFPITGAAVGEEESRIDFDMEGIADIPDKTELSRRMMSIVDADHPIDARLIDEAALDADPSLVKSKNVRPPRGTGTIRLIEIGEDAEIDSQPCGGTHVSRSSEIGGIHIGKIEKKGRQNRRFRIRFGALAV